MLGIGIGLGLGECIHEVITLFSTMITLFDFHIRGSVRYCVLEQEPWKGLSVLLKCL